MASVLTIAGAVVDRAAARVKLDRWRDSLDEYPTLEFHQVAATLPGGFHPGQSIGLTIDGALRFAGQIVSRHPAFDGASSWTIGYRALGLKYLGNLVAVTNPNDLTGTITYNLPPDDPDYLSNNAGLSVGTILQRLFDGHATQLTAAGIGTYTLAELTPLTLVPAESCTFAGPHLFNAIDQFIERWAGHYVCYVEPGGAIRVRDTTAFPTTTLTLGVDPINPPALERDTEQCYTRVVIRGWAEVEAANLSQAAGTLTPAWVVPDDETAWKWSDFAQPNGATDTGTVSNLTSSTLDVTSDDVTRTWAVNFWNSNSGTIALINDAVTGVEQTEYRRVTASTALAAGGTATITLDVPLANSGYTKYRLMAQPVGSRVDVYRRYNITSTWIKAHLVSGRFPYPVPWAVSTSVQMVSYKAAQVFWGLTSWPWPFEVDQLHGQVRFLEPTVKGMNIQSVLDTGGSGVIKPTDVVVLLPYSRGTLTAVAPPDDAGGNPTYSGTAFTVDGIQRTWTIDLPSWIDKRNQAAMAQLAAVYLATVQDSVVTGSVVYNGKYTPALTLGMALNLAGDNGAAWTTGLETLAAPVHTVTLEWPADGGNAYVTTLGVSTRRKQATGDRQYIHPSWLQAPAWEGFSLGLADYVGGDFGGIGDVGPPPPPAGPGENSDE